MSLSAIQQEEILESTTSSSIEQALSKFLSEERTKIALNLDLRITRDKNNCIEAISIKPNALNLDIILRQDPDIGNKIRECELGGLYKEEIKIEGVQHLDTRLQTWLLDTWKIDASVDLIFRKVSQIAYENRFHPTRDFLNSLAPWDGISRFGMLEECLSAEPAERDGWNALLLKKYWIQLVHMVMNPGGKGDTTLVLIGHLGGEGKTTFAGLLGYNDIPERNWFGAPDLNLKNGMRDTTVQVVKHWIVEVGEFDKITMDPNLNSLYKDFSTKQEYQVSEKYQRRDTTFKRSVNFLATTNEKQFLRFQSGSRRYFPFVVGKMDLEGFKAIRDLLLAEALYRYRQGEPHWLSNEEACYFEEEFITAFLVENTGKLSLKAAISTLLLNYGDDRLEQDGLGFLEIREALPEHLQKATNDRSLSVMMNELGWRSKRVKRIGGMRWFETPASRAKRADGFKKMVGALPDGFQFPQSTGQLL